jgi:hypothetical protein
MTKRTKRALSLAGCIFAPILAIAGFLWFVEWPGGMRPDYAAADYDPRLTQEAATAKPLIVALKRYHDDHSAFPAHAADLLSYLSSPPAQLSAPDYILDWDYYRLPKRGGYVLSRKLGWDPRLKYSCSGSESHWSFDPGDGSPEKTLLLKP